MIYLYSHSRVSTRDCPYIRLMSRRGNTNELSIILLEFVGSILSNKLVYQLLFIRSIKSNLQKKLNSLVLVVGVGLVPTLKMGRK